MDNYKRLLQECEKLKQRLKELEQRQVGINYEPIHEIQVKAVKDELSKIGRQITKLMIYKKGDNND